MNRSILKQRGEWVLVRITELKYFKNGRANMHVARRYHIEMNDPESNTGIFNMKTLKEANSEWSMLFKTGSIGGAKLKGEIIFALIK